MDSLEKFMLENRKGFDVHNPSPDVWKRINKKVKLKKLNYTRILKYAAAIIIFISGFAIGSFQKGRNTNSLAINTNSTEIIEQLQIVESEYYYITEINARMNELKPFFASDTQLKQDIDTDFKELDTYYNQLKVDLKDNFNNDEVIEAMIHSYQVKLEILELLLIQLKPIKNQKRDV